MEENHTESRHGFNITQSCVKDVLCLLAEICFINAEVCVLLVRALISHCSYLIDLFKTADKSMKLKKSTNSLIFDVTQLHLFCVNPQVVNIS